MYVGARIRIYVRVRVRVWVRVRVRVRVRRCEGKYLCVGASIYVEGNIFK